VVRGGEDCNQGITNYYPSSKERGAKERRAKERGSSKGR